MLNDLCCEINMEAACLKCSWKICEKCWDNYSKTHPGELHPVYEVHNTFMKGHCHMSESSRYGRDFTRANEESYEPD